MARFILDIETKYENGLGNKILNDFNEFCNQVGEIAIKNGSSFSSITLIDEHNTAQFHNHNYKNKLTKKQIRKFNENPHT